MLKKGKYFATFLFLMLCPLLFRTCTIEASNIPRFLLVVFLLYVVFVKWLFQQRSLYSLPRYPAFLIGAYYLINILSACWSLNVADALYESQKNFLVPCLLLLFMNWLHKEEEEFILVRSLIIITLLYCIYTVVEILQLPDLRFETLYGINAFAEHKNLLASFLFLLSAFPLYGLFYFKSNWKVFSGLVFGITFLLVLFLQTRSVYFAVALSGLMLVVSFRKSLIIYKRRALIVFVASLLLFALIAFIYPGMLQRLNVFSYSSSESGSERLKIWSKTINLIKEHSLAGVGAGNWQYNFSKHGIGDIENISRRNISFQRPHNDLLWILSESGIIGFGLIILIMVFVFKKAYPALKAGDPKVSIFFSFLCGLLVESFFSFPKERITHIFLASVMFAVLLNAFQVKAVVNKRISRMLLVLILVVLSFSCVVGLYRLKGEYNTVLLLKEKENNNPRALLRYGTKAISVFYKSDPTSTPVYSYIGWAYNALNKTDSLLYISQLAYVLSPYDHEVLSNYGSALDRNGKRQEARVILKEALRINPFYEPALINLVVVEYNSRNYAQAMAYLQLLPSYEVKYKMYFDKLRSKLSTN